MDQETIARYQPGGDIFSRLTGQYGLAQANAIAAAAETGDRAQLSNAIALARGDGPALDSSTGSILVDQLETNPLAAPLGSANKLIGNSLVSLIKNPLVLGAIGVGAFFALGGADVLRRWIKNL
jgi:hypothetical protein